MRRFIAGVTAAAAVVTLFGSMAAAQIASINDAAKQETIRGVLVLRLCYMADPVNNKGNDHKHQGQDVKGCATNAVDAGQQLALVTADSKIYTISGGLRVNKYMKLVPHIGKTIEVTGGVTGEADKLTITGDNFKVVS
jgi:hypothetical protein